MSVILGYQTKEKIIIAGDNRLSDADGKIKSGKVKKLLVYNDHLCVATAGNRLGYLILEAIYKQNDMSDFYMEDFARKISELYKKNQDNILFKFPINYIMGGKGRSGECGMINIVAEDGKLKPTPCIEVLYPPDGLEQSVCNEILYKYIQKNPDNFYAYTIRKISNKNKFVSCSGDVWIFDLKSEEGTLKHFI